MAKSDKIQIDSLKRLKREELQQIVSRSPNEPIGAKEASRLLAWPYKFFKEVVQTLEVPHIHRGDKYEFRALVLSRLPEAWEKYLRYKDDLDRCPILQTFDAIRQAVENGEI